MCGLVGIAGEIREKQIEIFKDMLYVDALRGWHATGVAHKEVKKDGAVTVFKRPVEASDFLNMRGATEVKQYPPKQFLLGHNRHATVGKHTSVNAHPFIMPTLVGAHNGTIRRQALEQIFKDDLKANEDLMKKWVMGDTDSELLYFLISTLGVENVIPKISLGAWALTWYDLEHNTLNFLRNSERPLYYSISEDGKTMYWGSEFWMVSSIPERAKAKLKTSDQGKRITVKQVPENTWLAFDLSGTVGYNHNAVIPDPIRQKIEGKKILTPNVTYYTPNQHNKGDFFALTSEELEHAEGFFESIYENIGLSDNKEGAWQNFLSFVDLTPDELGEVATKNSHSCVMCDTDIQPDEIESGRCFITDTEFVVCPVCADNFDVPTQTNNIVLM